MQKGVKMLEKIIEALKKTGKYEFAPSSPEYIQFLKDHQFSKKIINFYEKFNPETICQLDEVFDGIRLFPIQEAIFETAEMYPGAALAPYSFFVIAANQFGDCYLIDGRNDDINGDVPIVFASHELFCGEVSEDYINENIDNVCESLYKFLELLSTEKIKN